MEILKLNPAYIVSGGPSIVPTHSKRLPSFFGNAEIPGDEDIIKVMSSLLSRFATLPAPCWLDAVTLDFCAEREGAREEVSCSM